MFWAGMVQQIQQGDLQLMPNRIAQIYSIGHNGPWLNKDNLIVVNRVQSCLQLADEFPMTRSPHASPLKKAEVEMPKPRLNYGIN